MGVGLGGGHGGAADATAARAARAKDFVKSIVKTAGYGALTSKVKTNEASGAGSKQRMFSRKRPNVERRENRKGE